MLETEIDRIGTNTEWGGKSFLMVDYQVVPAFTIQLGVDNSQTINISIDGMIDTDLTTASGGLGLSSTVLSAGAARAYLTKIDAAISVIASTEVDTVQRSIG